VRLGQLELLTDETENLKQKAEDARIEMEAKYADFMNVLGSSTDVFIDQKIKLYKTLLSNITDPDYVNYVLDLSKPDRILFNNTPLLSKKNDFATAYYIYEFALFAVQDNLTRIREYNQAGTTIIDDENYTFNPSSFPASHINKTIKTAKNKVVNFEVNKLGATVANGTVALDYFFNIEQDKVSAYNLIVNSGLAEVKNGAKLEIPATTFEAFVPETFEWVAGKTTAVMRTAQQTFISKFVISSIKITNAGTGYITTPSVSIDPPPAGGTQATAVAVRTGANITAITITNPGSGYISAPKITIEPPAPPGGTTARAEAEQQAEYMAVFLVPDISEEVA
jgi:hypothetical protein